MKRAYILTMICAVLWGSTASVIKVLGLSLNSFNILRFTTVIAFISLLVIAISKHKLPLLRTYKTKDYARFLVLSVLGIVLYYILLYTALIIGPSQEAFVINYTWPIWVVIFSVFILKERFHLNNILGLSLGFIGAAIVVSRGNLQLELTAAPVLALFAAISYGVFSALSKKFNYDKLTSTLIYYGISAIIMVLLLPFIPPQLPKSSFDILGLLWIGVFTSGIAFVLWQEALQKGDTHVISNLIFITPFISLLFLSAFTHENILPSSLLGALLIVLGAIISTLRSIRHKRGVGRTGAV